MRSQEMRQVALEYLARGVPAAQLRFDPQTGRFLSDNGGWAVTHQDVILPLALLYQTAGTQYHQNAGVLSLAARGGDALRDQQDQEGRFEFVKPDGSRWGKTYMCWSMYHWVEAYGLLRGEMDPERRARWEAGLRLCFDGIIRELGDAPRAHNINCWHGMALVRAAQLLAENSWLEAGKRIIRRHVAAQSPEGYWDEGAGPSTSYNLVYVHAIGLYYWFTGDESVLPCLERALDFHLHFTYPDGACVATVDGRVRHHGSCFTMGYPGLLPFPAGRRLVAHLLGRLALDGPEGAPSPYLAPVVMHLPAGPQEPIPQEKRDFVSVHHGRALVRRKGPWFYCLSGYLTPTEGIAEFSRHRWILDRQNYLSVWHERARLVIGGGNSKNQPEFSTFEVTAGRVRRLQADEATVQADAERDVLKLSYGDARCELSVSAGGDGQLELAFHVAQGPDEQVTVTGGFTIPALEGKTLCASNRDAESTLDSSAQTGLGWPASASQRWVQLGPLRIALPADSGFHWPVYPYNPYAINNAAAPAQAVAVVSFPLAPGGPAKKFGLTVTDVPGQQDDR